MNTHAGETREVTRTFLSLGGQTAYRSFCEKMQELMYFFTCGEWHAR